MPIEIRLRFGKGQLVSQTTGIKGSHCAEINAALRKNLGATVKRAEFTDEFYEQPPAVTTQENQQTQEG